MAELGASRAETAEDFPTPEFVHKANAPIIKCVFEQTSGEDNGSSSHLALVLHTSTFDKEIVDRFYAACNVPDGWNKKIYPVDNKKDGIEHLEELSMNRSSNVAIFYFGHGEGGGRSLACDIDDSKVKYDLERYLFMNEIGEAALKNPNLLKCYVFLGCCYSCGGDIVFNTFNSERKRERKKAIFMVHQVGSEVGENIITQSGTKTFSSAMVTADFVIENFSKYKHIFWKADREYINVTHFLSDSEMEKAIHMQESGFYLYFSNTTPTYDKKVVIDTDVVADITKKFSSGQIACEVEKVLGYDFYLTFNLLGNSSVTEKCHYTLSKDGTTGQHGCKRWYYSFGWKDKKIIAYFEGEKGPKSSRN